MSAKVDRIADDIKDVSNKSTKYEAKIENLEKSTQQIDTKVDVVGSRMGVAEAKIGKLEARMDERR